MEKEMKTNIELNEKLMHHIERGGKTHPIVDDETDGFMSSNSFKALNGFINKRQWIQDQDINKLPPGLYEGVNFTNGPLQQNVISEVDITFGNDGRKQIKYVNNGWSTTWEKTIHTNSEFSLGWGIVPKEVILWQGKDKLLNEVKLSHEIHGGNKSLSYYRAYKVVYSYYGNVKCDICYSNLFENEVTFNALNIANDSSELLMAEVVLKFNKDGKRVKIGDFREVSINKKGLTKGKTYPKTNHFYVKQIIGII